MKESILLEASSVDSAYAFLPSLLTRWEPIFTTIHMGSSKDFIDNKLVKQNCLKLEGPMAIDLNQLVSGGVQVKREVKI